MCTPNQPIPPAPPPGRTPSLPISCSSALSQPAPPPAPHPPRTGEPGRGTGHMALSHCGPGVGPPSLALWAARSSAPVFSPRGSSSSSWTPARLPSLVTPPGRASVSCPSPAQVPSRSPGRGLCSLPSPCPSPVTPPAHDFVSVTSQQSSPPKGASLVSRGCAAPSPAGASSPRWGGGGGVRLHPLFFPCRQTVTVMPAHSAGAPPPAVLLSAGFARDFP